MVWLLSIASFVFRKCLLKLQATALGALEQYFSADSRKPARMRWRVSPSSPQVSADEQLLNLAVSNLLDNALNYFPPHTLVGVSLR